MRVVLERHEPTRSMRVWLLPADENGWGFETFAFASEPAPSLVMPTQWFDALVREALAHGGVAEPDALADARAVRDRLFAMVEAEWAAKVEGR